VCGEVLSWLWLRHVSRMSHASRLSGTHVDMGKFVIFRGFNTRYLQRRQHTATRCNTLQHAATHCNTPQHTATQTNPHARPNVFGGFTTRWRGIQQTINMYRKIFWKSQIEMVCTGDGFSVSEESQNMGKGFSKSLRISKSFRISGSYQYSRFNACYLHMCPYLKKKEMQHALNHISTQKKNGTRIELCIDTKKKKQGNTHW